MSELLKYQSCPYCDRIVEDNEANWTEDEEEVTCDSCRKAYRVRAEYTFEGFEVTRLCGSCDSELLDDEGTETNVCEDREA
ncbi:hypothetical protein [Marinococcus halophilus]|uniref:hypothetical protein n=1 Tax=Marinococcus halophilus TaxID=1371 RepID=UPI0009A80EF3|nr:hypothetical protein [Marinococcus halophilus]